jgi:uncharacterized membrane protein
MGVQNYKVLILVVTAVLALLVASPAVQRLLVYPQTEHFTELWLLSSGHMAKGLPYNITRGESYSMFLGISNHLGNCSYYSLQVKFRNLTQSRPDSFNRTASSLPPLYSLNLFVADKETWELPVSFMFDYSYDTASSTVNFNSLTFNGEALNLPGYRSTRNSTTSVVFGNLVFELWIYNDSTESFQYHERYVDLKFNMLV